MKIFDEIFKQNKKAALKNRGKKDNKNIRTVNVRKSSYKENISEEISKSKEDELINNISIYNTLDAEQVSEQFERDSRRYSNGFDKDSGVIDL